MTTSWSRRSRLPDPPRPRCRRRRRQRQPSLRSTCRSRTASRRSWSPWNAGAGCRTISAPTISWSTSPASTQARRATARSPTRWRWSSASPTAARRCSAIAMRYRRAQSLLERADRHRGQGGAAEAQANPGGARRARLRGGAGDTRPFPSPPSTGASTARASSPSSSARSRARRTPSAGQVHLPQQVQRLSPRHAGAEPLRQDPTVPSAMAASACRGRSTSPSRCSGDVPGWDRGAGRGGCRFGRSHGGQPAGRCRSTSPI